MSTSEINVDGSIDGASTRSENDDALSASVAAAVRAGLEELNRLDVIDSARATREALEIPTPPAASASPTLIYWSDEMGERSFVTEKNLISA